MIRTITVAVLLFIVGNMVTTTLLDRVNRDLTAPNMYFITPNSYPETIVLNGKTLKLPLPGTEDNVFHDAVASMAEETNNITIRQDCNLTPQVFRVAEGSIIHISNSDTTNHLIVIHGQEYTVLPGSFVNIPASFRSGPSLYGIKCDSYVRVVGYVDVIR